MQSDMIERGDPLFAVFGQNLRRATFNFFILTVDGGLLQPTGCKDNTSQVHFRSVNLCQEFPYRSDSE